MKCQKCGEKASFHITDIIDGKAKEVHLCDKHAQEYLHRNPGPNPDAPVFDPVADSDEVQYDEEEKKNEPELKDLTESLENSDDVYCESCQESFLEFRKMGRFGCENCYNVFRERVSQLLTSIHGSATHMGKYPKSRQSEHAELGAQLVRMRSELEEAINIEDYEYAAKLRDKINEINAKIG